MLTVKPIYGATCAPPRRFAEIIEEFRRAGWPQCADDPCIYRYEEGNVIVGVDAIHVEDILIG